MSEHTHATPSELMHKSDPLSSIAHRWGNTNMDVLAAQKQVQAMDLPAYPLEVSKDAGLVDLDAQEV